MKLDFSRQIFKKNCKYQVRPVGSNCSIRTEMTKLVVAFLNFSDAPKSHFSRGFMWVWYLAYHISGNDVDVLREMSVP